MPWPDPPIQVVLRLEATEMPPVVVSFKEADVKAAAAAPAVAPAAAPGAAPPAASVAADEAATPAAADGAVSAEVAQDAAGAPKKRRGSVPNATSIG